MLLENSEYEEKNRNQDHSPFFLMSLLIFGLAFLWRLRFLVVWQSTPYGIQPLLDAAFYHNWASKIAAGQLFSETAFYQSPLYAYFLGLLYSIFEPSVLLASIAQLLLSSFTCLFVAWTAWRSFGVAAGLCAGFLAAFYAPFVFYVAPTLKESLSLFMLVLFLHEAQRNLSSGKSGSTGATGFLLGLSVLTRGNYLLLAPAFLLGLFWQRRKAAWLPSVLFLLGLALAILPATVHNAWTSRDFVPVTYNDGFNFYIGNGASSNAAVNGVNAYPPNISTDPLGGEERDTRRYAAHFIGHDPTPSEVSSFWYDQALQNIAADPFAFATRLFLKARLFLNGHEIPDNYDQTFYEQHFDLLLKYGSFHFPLILGAAAFSAFLLIRQRHRDAFLYLGAFTCYAFSAVIFYVTDRYRLPAVLFLMPLAAAAPVLTAHCVQKKEKMLLAIALTIGLSAFLFSNLDTAFSRKPGIEAHNWALISWLYYMNGDYSKTLDALEQGIAISETSTGGPAYLSGAEAAARLNQNAKVEELLLKATSLYPTWDPAYFALYNWYMKTGHEDRALPFLQNAYEIDPENVTYRRELTQRLRRK